MGRGFAGRAPSAFHVLKKALLLALSLLPLLRLPSPKVTDADVPGLHEVIQLWGEH